jgi:DNA-directed RNA polymerase specialized sigma24 family protein
MYQALKYQKFQLDKGFSPFSYFTTIAFHAFISRIKKEKKHHQLIADYRERNYDSLINKDEESTGIRICSKPASGELDNSSYNESNA